VPELALVTGAPGWAASRLVALLAGGPFQDRPTDRSLNSYARVRCLVLPDTDTASLEGVEVVRGDLRDPAAVGRFTRGSAGADLYHFAGVVHPRRSVRELWEVNDLGTRVLLAHATAAGVRRIVALSSNSPVGVSRRPTALFDEDTPCRPYLSYGASKLAMEQAVRGSALEWALLRPCWFYGPGQPERQTLFYRMLREGRAPLVGGGVARRSVSYVDSIATAALLAAASPVANGRTYWIADARPYPFSELLDTIEAVLRDDFGLPVTGRRARLPSLASDLSRVADATLQRAGLYEQRLHVMGELNLTIACSVERARRELGWNPGPGLREGTRRAVQWCLERGAQI
jgi:nucleoside-diphosphate-sugar epimerase